MKSKKLQILSFLAALLYFVFIFNTIISEFDSIQLGYHGGYYQNHIAEVGENFQYDSELKDIFLSDIYFCKLKPKHGFASFPDSIVNLKDQQTFKTKNEHIIISMKGKEPTPFIFKFYKPILWFLSFVLFVVYIMIPIHFFKLLRLIEQNSIYEKANIILIRWLGIDLIMVFIVTTLMNYFQYQVHLMLFEFSKYQIVMDSFDIIPLLIGITVFLFNEIITKANHLKEEQELTI